MLSLPFPSFLSAITLLGTPATMYVAGTQYAMIVVTFPVVMVVAGYIYLPVFYNLAAGTSYEVREAIYS